MDANAIVSLVGSLGFPIAACCVMFWQNSKMQETLSELTKTLTVMNDRLSDVEQAVKENEYSK